MEFILALLLLLLCSYHLSTIDLPSVYYDDAGYVSYALHGEYASWKQIVPKEQALFLNRFYFGTIPAALAVIKNMVSLFGLGVWQIRIFNLSGALLGIGILIFWIRKMHGPLICVVPVFLFAMSDFFMRIGHQSRSEGVIFGIFMLNIYWLYLNRGRVAGLVAGFLAALALSFHLSAALLAIVIPLLMVVSYPKDMFQNSRYAWWGVGALAGLIIVMNWINLDQFFAFLVVGKERSEVLPMPIVEAGLDPFFVLFHLVSTLLGRWMDFYEGVKLFYWTVSFTSVALLLRRYSILNRFEKSALIISLAVLGSYAMFSGSNTDLYFVYFHPWLMLNNMNVFLRCHRKPATLEKEDHYLMALVLLTFILCKAMLWEAGFVLFSLALLGFFGALLLESRGISSRYFIAGTLYISLLLIETRHMSVYQFAMVENVVRRTPIILSLLFIVPISWVLLRKRGLVAYLSYLYLFGWAGWLAFDICKLPTEFAQRKQIEDFNTLMMSVPDKRRVVAPEAVWIYNPALPVQSELALRIIREHRPSFSVYNALKAYHPTFILWYEPDLPALYRDRGSEPLLRGDRVDTPMGNYCPIYIRQDVV